MTRAPDPPPDDEARLPRLEARLALCEALLAARGPDDVARAAVQAARRAGALRCALLAHQAPGGRNGSRSPSPAGPLDLLAADGLSPEEAADLASLPPVRAGLAAPAGEGPGATLPLDDLGTTVLGVFGLGTPPGDPACLLAVVPAAVQAAPGAWQDLASVARLAAPALLRALQHRRLEAAFQEARDAQRRLVQAEKQSAIGRLAAGLAHEIGTPLNVISGRAELLYEDYGTGNPRAAQAVRTITTQVERIGALVRKLLDFAREHGPVRERIALAPVVEGVADLVRPSLLKAGADLVLQVPPSLPAVFANAHQLQQVFLNLLMNSQDAIVLDPDRATKGRGRIVVVADALDRRTVRVRVADTGHGIQPGHLDKVFDPFFSTKPVGTGTGLGLAVVYGVVTEHGGTVDIRSAPGEGTTVTLTLPTAAD